MINTATIESVFTPEFLGQLFPSSRSNDFFDALFGDPDEGAFDISLSYRGCTESNLELELQLKERPGHCLACNLTQGLPTVFSRHPVINIAGIVEEVGKALDGAARCGDWQLGYTQQRSRDVHIIPLTISLS